MSRNRPNAFSLIELSIVIVILGLLIGGVLAGQSLIRAAALRSVGIDYQKFTSAVQQFQNEFAALPGDMANAQSYWGVAHATPATCVTTQGTGTQTCNGNGDGLIAVSTGSAETFRFWQHLVNAGLLVGNYTGVRSATNVNSSTAANVPSSKIATGLWSVINWGTFTGNGLYFNGDYLNSLILGSVTTDNYPASGLLRPDEMYNVDRKMDDGKPGTGSILAIRYTTCTTTSDPAAFATAEYALSSTNQAACMFVAPTAFAIYSR